MSKSVWKFPLPVKNEAVSVSMPEGSEILYVAEQHGEVCLWALVSPDNDKTERQFLIVGTGHKVPEDDLAYVGTAMMYGGGIVLHVFEKQ